MPSIISSQERITDVFKLIEPDHNGVVMALFMKINGAWQSIIQWRFSCYWGTGPKPCAVAGFHYHFYIDAVPVQWNVIQLMTTPERPVCSRAPSVSNKHLLHLSFRGHWSENEKLKASFIPLIDLDVDAAKTIFLGKVFFSENLEFRLSSVVLPLILGAERGDPFLEWMHLTRFDWPL